MTPEQLQTIRDAVKKVPTAFDDRGRCLLPRGRVQFIGPVAIGHRKQLLEYVDELRERLRILGEQLGELDESLSK